MAERPNGTKFLNWVLGVSTTIILGGGGAWMSVIHAQVREIASLQQMRGDRMSVLEAKYDGVAARLTRIEEKTDRVLERLPR